jgi:excisionase family DNA binding protein
MHPIGTNQSQPKPPNLLTARQVAEFLQWNPYTVIKKAEKGELPGFKLGREWRFRQEDITAWIEAKRNGDKP